MEKEWEREGRRWREEGGKEVNEGEEGCVSASRVEGGRGSQVHVLNRWSGSFHL